MGVVRYLGTTITGLTLLLSFAVASPVEARAYKNNDRHFSLEVPDDWQVIPRENLDKTEKNAKETAGVDLVYDAGFASASRAYVLVQLLDAPGIPLDNALKILQNNLNTDDIKKAETLMDAQVNAPYIDEDRSVIVTKTSYADSEGMTALMMGKDHTVQLNFYSPKDKYEESVPMFESIIDSFSYDKGYGYGDSDDQSSIVVPVAIGSIVVLLVAGVLVWRKKKK